MQEKTIVDYMKEATEADLKGIPVDWKAVAVMVYNATMAQIQKLQEDAATPQVEEERA